MSKLIRIVFTLVIASNWAMQVYGQDLELNQSIFRSAIEPQAVGQGFGQSIDAYGRLAVIGAPFLDSNTGGTYLFRFNGKTWSLLKKLETPPDAFSRIGEDVAIHGDWIAVAMSRYVVLYQRDTGGVDNWGYHSTLGLEDDANFRSRFIDNSVTITGSTLAIGAPETDTAPFSSATDSVGSVLIFKLTGPNWTFSDQINVPAPDLIAGARFGSSVELTSSILAVGSADYNTDGLNSAGRAWIYEPTGAANSFQRTSTLTSDMPLENANFGSAVTIGSSYIAIGSPSGAGDLTPGDSNDGSVYTFEKSGDEWMMTDELLPSTPGFLNEFGQSVSAAGNLLLTASDDASYLFIRRGNGDWSEIDRDAAPTFPAPSNIREFGVSVALLIEGTRIHGLIGDASAEDGNDDRVGATFFYLFEDGLFNDRFED